MKKLIALVVFMIVARIMLFADTASCCCLRNSLYDIVDKAPGTVGIAFVSDTDTVTVNNGVRYAMMSVFKLHQALAVAETLEHRGVSLDTLLHINAVSLDRQTWSPMLREVGDGDFDISVRRLMEYALTQSDNNASNILFQQIVSPEATDSIVRSFAPDDNFAIYYSEAQMKAENVLSYSNFTSPLAAALLIRKVCESPVSSGPYSQAVLSALEACTTGQDRICAPLKEIPGVRFGHKTGSGYRNSAGELMAHNDVAYVMLPDGRSYSLAVLIRDFAGTEAEASAIMSEVSATVFRFIQ